jgi:TonB family protein
MRRTISILIAAGLLVASTIAVEAQETKNTPKQPSTESKEDQKGEVDLAIEELKKRGEEISIACSDDCKDKTKKTGGTLNGRAIHLEQPAYPALAAAAHVFGDVIVLVLMDKQGKIIAAQIVDGHPFLQNAALKAAKASSFSPPLLDGVPVNIVGRIVYHFVAPR